MALTPEEDRARERRYREKHKDERNAYGRAYVQRKKSDPEWMEKRRARARRAAKSRRGKITEMVLDAKRGPCVDCGVELPPQIMDLDHVRGEKIFTLGHASRGSYHSYAEIATEIAKCDLRCPNCHRLRHFTEGYVDDQGGTRSRRVRDRGNQGSSADGAVLG